MQVHILIDHAKSYEDSVTGFRTKRELVETYITHLKTECAEFADKVYTCLKNDDIDLDDESVTEMIRALENKPYDADLIDLYEYFRECDCDTEYHVVCLK